MKEEIILILEAYGVDLPLMCADEIIKTVFKTKMPSEELLREAFDAGYRHARTVQEMNFDKSVDFDEWFRNRMKGGK